jgi:phage gpG-like protein
MESNAREISIKIKKGAEVIARNLQTYLLKLTALQIYYIKQRVEKGVDVDGNPLTPNVGNYAKRKLEVVGHVKPLQLSGSMINSMISELINNRSARVTFSSNMLPGTKGIYDKMKSDMISNKAKAAKTNEDRPFFAISDKEVDKLNDALLKMIREDLKNALQ